MEPTGENLRFILGLKLKQFRRKKGLSLKELADRTKVSISFLSEIEKGKKYPKPVKLVQIANALEISYDDLVSLKVDKELGALTSLLDSPLLKEIPFELIGITPRDLVELMTNSPNKAGAFIRTFLEIGETYDMRVEHFLLAALRSYQKMNNNYFEEIETAVNRFRTKQKWKPQPVIEFEALRSVFMERYGFSIEETTFERFPALTGFRSVWIAGQPEKLIINKHLKSNQKAFILGRELGYLFLGLQERAKTSSWLKVESFEQVLNNFKASYFAGALLINKELLRKDLALFFKKKRWDGDMLLEIMHKYNATPEMFLYRLSQLIPRYFGLNEIYYIRFNNRTGTESFQLTKDLNMSHVHVPRGIGLNEHYCRRWLSITLLKELAERQKNGDDSEAVIATQRTRFVDSDAEFLTITLARPLSLSEGTNASISLGFYVNDNFRRVVKFWADPAIPRVDVNETCERCGLSQSACSDRVSPPVLYEQQQNQLIRENTLQDFLQEMEG